MNLSSILVAGKMSAAILKSEMEKEARVYFALRFLDRNGQGNFSLNTIYKQLSEKSSDTFLLDRRYLKERIQSGSGTFWYIKDDRLWLFAIEKILMNVGGETFGVDAADLTFGDVFTSHKRFKRAMYEIVHCVRNDHPIARETLRAMTGLGRKAQRNLEGHMCVEENFARTNLFWTKNNTESTRWYKPHMFKMTCKVEGKVGSYIAFQIANSYTPFDREVKQVSCSLKKKNKILKLLNGENGTKKYRERENQVRLNYGTTPQEIAIIRNGEKREKFTYYFRNGQWKAVLPTKLHEETFNKEYDAVVAMFSKMGVTLPSGDDTVPDRE